jgi:hypothetical protein
LNGSAASQFNSPQPADAQHIVRQGKFDLSHSRKKKLVASILSLLRRNFVGGRGPNDIFARKRLNLREFACAAKSLH